MAANTDRCVRCGRSSKKIKKNMPATVRGQGGREKTPNTSRERRGTSHLGGHDMVGRVDRHGEALIWCRKCPGCARQRLGRKWMNRCKPENMDTKECRKM